MRRRLVRAAGAVCVALALLLACEGALRLAGFRAQLAGGNDALLNALPLFHPVTDSDGVVMMQRRDAPVAFRQEKPANGLRVFVIGESSAFGFPFGPEFAFSRFLQERLAAGMPTRTVEVVNAAIPGIGSWQVRQVADEIASYRPDILVVYMGHNELSRVGPEAVSPFVRAASRSRFYQLAVVAGQAVQAWRHGAISVERMRRETDPFGPIRDRARGVATLTSHDREWSLARYRENLHAIVRTAQAAGATVVLAGLAQNLSDSPPGASRHRRGLSADQRARWRAAMEQAAARMKAQDYRGALADLRTALHIDQRPAILHYMRGQCFEALGRFTSARAAYRDASDLDEVPLGAPNVLNLVTQEVAAETGAQFVDVLEALRRSSPHGLVGGALFFDSIHPTVAGHAAIARILAEALGAPAGAGQETDVQALLAAHPEIQDKIYRTNAAFYLILGWHDKAQAEMDEAVQHYPKLRQFRDSIEAFRAKDPVRAWDDLPDAAE